MSNADVEAQDALEAIAVIGMSGRFPGADDLERFWHNLKTGTESITFFTDQELEAAGVSPEALRHPDYVKARGILNDIERFDAAFFGFTPREAEITDPQHRLFLECAWEAMESAGYDSNSFGGSVGVYAGCSMSSYFNHNLSANAAALQSVDSLRVLLGNDKDYLTTRASYKLNLKGPSVDVQTTCSTSLVAVHLACQTLLNYQCDMALAGGVSLDVPQRAGYFYKEGGISPPDGHCRAFSAGAQGSVNGSGVGVVVLKRLEDALADGDTILAVIKGTAINNDGAQKVSYTAPSVDGQAQVIALAQAVAGVHPETISYVEAHGSGTALGDPIEIAALTQAFGASTRRRGFVAVGSVKTNIGHVGAAAGIAGLIKTVLALKHKVIPPSLHFEEPNPQINFDETPFYVNSRPAEWKANGGPRRAGVSSFGVGGTNAHAVLEEAPPREPSGPSAPWQLLLLSAKTGTALERATDNLAAHLKEHPEQNLADVAYTLKLGRTALGHRRALVCRGTEDATAALEARSPKRVLTGHPRPGRRSVVFMFPGLGDHYVNIAAGLYQTHQKFREQVDLCCELLKPHLGLDLRDVLYPGGVESAEERARPSAEAAPAGTAPQGFDLRKMVLSRRGGPDEPTQKLNLTYLAQPAVFVIEYALARLWMGWGVKPEAMIGYSVGEYVAACLAGVFSLEDALRLVARRARMIQDLPGGAMLAVPLPEGDVLPLLRGGAGVSGINGPSMCVVSGPPEAVASLERDLKERGVACQQLQTTHAFHSGMMEPTAESFKRLVESVERHPPRIPYISNVTGTWVSAEEATDPAYWSRHLCEAVRFADGLRELWKEPARLLLEVGPGQLLSSLAIQQATGEDREWAALPSMRPYYDRQEDAAFLLNAVGRLWLAGVEVDWSRFYADERRHRVPLPTYPFERQRYWVERQSGPARPAEAPAGKAPDLSDWFYLPSWRRSLPPRTESGSAAGGAGEVWLVLADECGLGAKLARLLEGENRRAITVTTGERFARHGEREFTLDPRRLEDYATLVDELSAAGLLPTRLLHMWGVTRAGEGTARGIELFTRAQDLGFNSLLYLAQAVGARRPEEAVHIGVVSNRMQDVAGGEELRPEKATVLVPARIVPQVYPQLTCRSIDIVTPEPGSREEERLLGLLVAELSPSSAGEVIAYRGRHRWVLDYQRARVEPEGGLPARLRQGGVYLITGGLNGVGSSLAEYLARAARARLVLIEEAGFPARAEWGGWLAAHGGESPVGARISEYLRLEGLGAELEVVGATLTDEAETRAAVARAGERFGALHGVFHTAEAGLAEPHKNAAAGGPDSPHSYQVKVYGVYHLAEALKRRDFDFCLLVSSLSAVVPGEVRMPQAAANVFLNAFAHAHAGDAGSWMSLNWDEATTAAEAPEVWRRVFSAGPLPQLVVSGEELTAKLRAGTGPGWEERAEAGGEAALHPRPNVGVPYVEPSGPSEQIIAGIWQKLLGIERVGVHDSFFQLGGNSLMGIQLISQVREAFHLDVPMGAIFDADTVGDLARVVEDLLLAEVEGMDEADAAQYSGD